MLAPLMQIRRCADACQPLPLLRRFRDISLTCYYADLLLLDITASAIFDAFSPLPSFHCDIFAADAAYATPPIFAMLPLPLIRHADAAAADATLPPCAARQHAIDKRGARAASDAAPAFRHA